MRFGFPGGLRHASTRHPLTPPKPAAGLKLPVASPAQFVKELGSLKLGALVGLGSAIVAQWLEPGSPPVSWSDGGDAVEFMIVGMALEGLLHYFAGWYVEPKFRQLRARREADLQLEDLDQAARDGVLDEAECHKIRARITRRKIAGGFKARRRRGPNKLRPAPVPAPVVLPTPRRAPPAPPAAA